MLLIIEGHLGMPSLLTDLAFSVHVPLFFLISGYLARPGKPGAIKKYAKRLLVPYVATGLLVAVIEALKALSQGGTSAFVPVLGEWLAATAFGSGTNPSPVFGIHMIGAIWFLLALFWALVAYEFVCRSSYAWPIVVCVFAAGLVSARYWWLPWSVQPACTALLFVHIGHEARSRGFDPHALRPAHVVVAAAVWAAALAVDHGRMYVVSSYFGCLPADVAGALAGTVVICWLSAKLEGIAWASAPLRYLGIFSMPVMCFHLIELNCVPWWDYAALFELERGPLGYMLVYLAKLCWAAFWVFACARIPVLRGLFIESDKKHASIIAGARS